MGSVVVVVFALLIRFIGVLGIDCSGHGSRNRTGSQLKMLINNIKTFEQITDYARMY